MYMKKSFSLLSLSLSLIICTALSPAIASASILGNIFHTSDTDFNGTTSQTAISGGSVGLGQWSCGQNITYNGYAYPTVLIGTQCWLAENLQTTLKPDGSALTSYCYSPGGCASPWGRLYDWNVTMNGATTATGCGAKIQGICPSGWHIPSDYTGCANDDFYLLSTYLGGDSVSGGHMKETGTAHWSSGNTGDNNSGFTGVGAGRWDGSSFVQRPDSGYFQTSFQNDGSSAFVRSLYYSTTSLYRSSAIMKTNGLSVRCVKDNLNPSYYSSGTYTSTIFQRAQVASWGNLNWNAIINTNTALTIKVRTCSAPDCSDCSGTTCAWSYCGNVDTGAAQGGAGVPLNSGSPNCVYNTQKYIQYQATLTSSDGVNTPYLNDILLDYQYNPDTSTMSGFVKFFGSITFK